MKNSSRLLAEIDRKRTRSSNGWLGLLASSRTRRLNASQLSSRLKYRGSASGASAAAGAAATSVRLSISFPEKGGIRSILPTACLRTETEGCYSVVTEIGMTPPVRGVGRGQSCGQDQEKEERQDRQIRIRRQGVEDRQTARRAVEQSIGRGCRRCGAGCYRICA